MSGTSARESYRSSKRTRPSDSQPSRSTPPVLFRLPSVPMPGHDSAANASNMNSAAMAMPMAAAAALPVSAPAQAVPATPAAPVAPAPSAPAQSAVATLTAEKASGQRLLNMLIVILLLAALAIITWISINRSTPSPSMADNKVGNDSALDTLGELKVPDMTSNSSKTTASAVPVKTDDHVSGLDEIKPSNPSDLSMIDLPDPHSASAKSSDADSESLLSGLDTSGTDSALANSPISSNSTPNPPTAQIQLRTPVPVGNSNVTSLVDASKPAAQLGGSNLSSSNLDASNSTRFETVSTPTQSGKIFPANTDSAPSSVDVPSASSTKTGNAAADGSPSLWDGAQRPSLEGLQLSGQPTSTNSTATQVTISSPLAAEISMNGAGPATTTDKIASQRSLDSSSSLGTTVGGGENEPYNLGDRVPAADNLYKSRADLNPTMLARVAASGAAKSAVNNSASQPASKPINSYAAAANMNTAGQNLYTNTYVNQTPANSNAPINGYALQGNVPPGVAGNGAGPYVPPTASMPNAVPSQMVSGPSSAPAMTAGFAVPPRGNQATYGQPAVQNNQGAQNNQGYAQQPRYPQSPTQPSGYAQPGAQPGYAQGGYAQPGYAQGGYAQGANSQVGYGQPNAYGAAPGSGYGNLTYPTPSAGMPAQNMPQNMPAQNMPAQNMPAMNMPGGLQNGTSYPVKNPYPGGQAPIGPIGPTGYATAPSGDIAPTPVMGTGGVRTSTPFGSPQ